MESPAATTAGHGPQARDAFEAILTSMGIDSYEPNVVTALSEYARSKWTTFVCVWVLSSCLC
jgi:hypothetical protein